MATAPIDDSMLPCSVFMALANACHRCHGRVPANGAPMSLVKWADFQRRSITKPNPFFYEEALARMNGSASPPMPPGGAITDSDKKTLIDWLGSGAPAADSGSACQ